MVVLLRCRDDDPPQSASVSRPPQGASPVYSSGLMRAVICRAWGPVDDLKLEDVAPPTPGPGQLVIDIRATGVNYADSIMVAGRYQTRPPFPFSPGLETAGVVTRRGEAVTRFKTGDRVMAILARSEEHTSELQSHSDLVCRLLLEKKKNTLERRRVIQNSK